MLEDTFLTQIVTQPTRENNLLDLVLVSDSDLASECKVGEKLNGCDHHLIRLTIRTGQELIENKSRIPDYRRANFSLARELLSRTTWEPVNSTPIDGAWNTFKCKLLEVKRTSVPMKTRRTNNAMSPPWITPQVRKAINLKRSRYILLKRNNTNEARDQYRQSLRACRNLIRLRKRDYEKQVAREAKSNPKMFFTYIRTKKRAKSNIGPLKMEGNVLTQDSKHVVEILNKTFASVFTVENTRSIPESPAPPREITPLEIGPINEREVQK